MRLKKLVPFKIFNDQTRFSFGAVGSTSPMACHETGDSSQNDHFRSGCRKLEVGER